MERLDLSRAQPGHGMDAAPWAIRPRNMLLPDGELRGGLDVVIAGDSIVDVVAEGAHGLPADRVVVSESGTLLPGLVDGHVHLTFGPEAGAFGNASSETAHEQVARAFGNAQQALAHGVTTVVDCGGRADVMLAVKRAAAAGVIASPGIVVSGPPITTTAGHCHWLGGVADTTDEVIRLARQLTQDGVDFIKIMLTGGNLTAGSNPRRLQYPDETMAALGAECQRLGKALVVHAHSEHAIRLAAACGATVIAHASCQDTDGNFVLADETVAELVRSGTIVDATITVGAHESSVGPPASTRRHEQRRAMIPLFSRMHDAGVVLLAGTDAGVPGVPHGAVGQAIVALHREVGMPLGAALLRGTREPARAFAIDDRVGSIGAGMQADLLLLEGDVTEDVAAVERPASVWSAGRLFRPDALPAAPSLVTLAVG